MQTVQQQGITASAMLCQQELSCAECQRDAHHVPQKKSLDNPLAEIYADRKRFSFLLTQHSFLHWSTLWQQSNRGLKSTPHSSAVLRNPYPVSCCGQNASAGHDSFLTFTVHRIANSNRWQLLQSGSSGLISSSGQHHHSSSAKKGGAACPWAIIVSSKAV